MKPVLFLSRVCGPVPIGYNAFFVPFNSMEHFPALPIPSLQQLRKGHTALMPAVGEDSALDFVGDDTHGLEERPS